MKVRDSMKVAGTLEIMWRDRFGNVKGHFIERNLVVDIGFDNINSLLRGSGGSALSHIGIGWAEPDATPSAPAAGDINLPMPGGTPPLANGKQQRYAAVLTRIDEKNFKLVATIGNGEPSTAGGFPVPIRSIGTFWDAGVEDSELFAWVLRAVMNKASADTFEITHTFTMS